MDVERTKQSVAKTVYRETAAFYGEVAPALGAKAFGYRIMYGPPLVRAPMLFLGYQPGGSAEDSDTGEREGERTCWPNVCVYAHAPWPLARRMRAIWGEQLSRCTGLNANFFRSPSAATWRTTRHDLRKRVEAFCLERAQAIVRALEPERIVIIGLGTFDQLASGKAAIKSRGRTLVKEGELWDRPAFGVVHLSGARMSREDFHLIRERLI